ncbi:MAG: hypothetical protein Q9222_007831 [Ikaeria aurantiellina]
MATVLPPPSKRQKTAISEKAREQQDIDTISKDLGSIRVHFVDQSTGQATGAPVLVPIADATQKNLELLLNKLQGNTTSRTRLPSKKVWILNYEQDTSERVPYSFTFSANGQIINISKNIYEAVVKPGLKTIEDTISLQYTPQAVFRVRAVSRCSAAIPGHGEAILTTSFASASSSRLVTGSGDNTARIFDTDTAGFLLHRGLRTTP